MEGNESIFIIPAGEKDRHGDPVGAPAAEVEVRDCLTYPRSSLEQGRGWVTIDGLNVFIPAGGQVPTARDQVRAREQVWAVEGNPAVYTGRGTIVNLKRAGT